MKLPERIETERLVLARLRYEDAEEIFYTYASKPEATKYLSFPTHQSVQDARSFLKYVVPAWDLGTELAFGIRLKTDNRFIGTIGAIDDNGKVHLGYCISPTQWDQGYTTEACTGLVNAIRKNSGIHRIWAFADAENIASHKVLMKSGMSEEAYLIKWFRFINQDNQPKDCKFFVFKE